MFASNGACHACVVHTRAAAQSKSLLEVHFYLGGGVSDLLLGVVVFNSCLVPLLSLLTFAWEGGGGLLAPTPIPLLLHPLPVPLHLPCTHPRTNTLEQALVHKHKLQHCTVGRAGSFGTQTQTSALARAGEG